jgi:hypothetical protein
LPTVFSKRRQYLVSAVPGGAPLDSLTDADAGEAAASTHRARASSFNAMSFLLNGKLRHSAFIVSRDRTRHPLDERPLLYDPENG